MKKKFVTIFESLKPSYILLIFTFLGYLVYYPGLSGDFMWDDEYQIIYTPKTYSIKNIPSVFLEGQLELLYRPMLFTHLTITHWLFGLNPVPFHFLQLLMHIFNTFFVFIVFRKFFAKGLSFVLSLFFLVHPMNVEAITHISAAGDPIYVFFGLLAFIVMSSKKLNIRRVILASFLMLLSLFGKESGVFVVITIFAYRLLFIKKSLFSSIVFASISLSSYFFMRFFVAGTFFKQLDYIPIALVPFFERLISIPKIIFFYFSTFIAPINLSIAQNWIVKEFSFWDFYTPLIIDVLIFVSVILYLKFLFKKHSRFFRMCLFFTIWFVVSCSVLLQLFPLDMTVGERWFYYPMIGLLGFIGVIFTQTKITNTNLRKLILIIAILLLVIHSVRSFIRNFDWRDDYGLFAHDIQISKNSFDLELNFGYQLMKREEYAKAMKHVKKSIELAPNFTATWTTAAAIYLRQEKYNDAKAYYLEGLKRDETNFAAYYGLIHVYLLQDDYVEAQKWAAKALHEHPNNPYLLSFLSVAEYNLGNKKKALDLASRAYERNYKDSLSGYLYHNLYRGRAIPHYKKYIVYN